MVIVWCVVSQQDVVEEVDWTIQGVEHGIVGHGRQVGDGNSVVCNDSAGCCGGG